MSTRSCPAGKGEGPATRFASEVSGAREQSLPTFTVAPGKVASVTAGPPLTAAPMVRHSDSWIFFSLDLSDSAGLKVSHLTVKGQRPPPPKIEVVDAAGKMIHSATMEYG